MLMQFNDKEAAVVLAGPDPPGRRRRRGRTSSLAILGRKIGGDWKGARGDAEVIAAIESALERPGAAGARGSASRRPASTAATRPALMAFAEDEKAAEEVRVAAIEAIGRIKPAQGRGVPRRPRRGRSRAKGPRTPSPRPPSGPRPARPRCLGTARRDDRGPGLPARPPPRGAADLRPASPAAALKVIALARDGKLPDELKTEATTLVHRDADRKRPERGGQGPAAAEDRVGPALAVVVRAGPPRGEGRARPGGLLSRRGRNACAACHRVQGHGPVDRARPLDDRHEVRQVGADPVDPQPERRDRLQLPLDRSSSLDDGRMVTGLVVEEAPDRLVLKTAEGQRVAIRPAEIEDRKQSEVSLMPEGLAQTMSDEDFVDLLAFLEHAQAAGEHRRPVPGRPARRRAAGEGSIVRRGRAGVASDGRRRGPGRLRPLVGDDAAKSRPSRSRSLAAEPIEATARRRRRRRT